MINKEFQKQANALPQQRTSTLAPSSLPLDNHSFVREDLLKKENRINVALYGAHAIPEFWEPLCALLGIPPGAWLTRVVIDGTGNRPDFILNAEGRTQGCIEVELSEVDELQCGRYRKLFNPVLCIVGKQSGRREYPSLAEVAKRAKEVAHDLQNTNRPAMSVLDDLAATIVDGLKGFRGRASVQPIPADLLALPWLATAIEPLLRLQGAGYVKNRTWSSRSLSLQLEQVPCMKGKCLALLTQRDAAVILLPAPEEMARVLGGALAEVTAAWDDLLNLVMPHWPTHVDGNNRVHMETKTFKQNAETFARVFALLADRIQAGH
jgi:hypothetical protein